MPGVGRNSYKAAMKKAKAKTNKKKTPLKKTKVYVGAEGSRKAKEASRAASKAITAAGRKKRTRTTSKVGPGGQSPNKSKNTKLQTAKNSMKNTTMPSRSSRQNNKRKKSYQKVGPIKRK